MDISLFHEAFQTFPFVVTLLFIYMNKYPSKTHSFEVYTPFSYQYSE